MDGIERDVGVARAWWATVAPGVPEGTEALWFGLGVFIRDDGRFLELYVAGCDEFDADDEAADWACEPSWFVATSCVRLPGLLAIDEQDFDAQLAHAAEVVRRLDPGADVEVSGVAVGFDEGDFELISS